MNKHTLRFIWGLFFIYISVLCFDTAYNPIHWIWLRMAGILFGIGTFLLGYSHIEKSIKE